MNTERQRICAAHIRSTDACLITEKNGLLVCFNKGADLLMLEHSFLKHFVYSDAREGTALANKMGARGWEQFGYRVSWRMTPYALEFSLASGRKYQLRKEALLQWVKDKGKHERAILEQTH